VTTDYVSKGELDAMLAEHIAKVRDVSEAAVQRLIANAPRTASKSHLLGSGGSTPMTPGDAGSFLLSILNASSVDTELQGTGKAWLAGMSSHQEPWGKATLGTTDATGGWIIPNALVETIVKPAMVANIYADLMTVRNGISAFAVDMPFRSALPARAQIAAFGATKENVDLVYNGYTATMYTLARIHDIGTQFVRQSAGAAEQDVMTELGTAFALGEAYYIRDGSGSSQPYGFVAAATNGPAAFRSTHTAAMATVAGSVARAIAVAGSALLARHRRPEAAVISAEVFAEMLVNGADTAGFFLSGIAGPQSVPGLRPGTLVSPWGVPVYVDPELNLAATDDDLYVGEWSAFRIYHGESFRVDTSSQAGTRWDANVTGFRGEMELGFDARPAVYAGAVQMVADVLS
jgi:HK97 family phage major capsid protein